MPLYIAAVAMMIIADQLVKHWAFTTLQAQHTIPRRGVQYVRAI